MKPLSKKLLSLPPSPTLAVAAKAKALAAQGKTILDFGVGEPNVDLLPAIKHAGVAAIEHNKSRYTPVAGIPELRQKIAEKLSRDNYLTYTPHQIVVSTGAKQSLYNIIAALANPGDEFLLANPCWVSYADIVTLCDAKPVLVPTQSDLQVRASDFAHAITPKTKALILNYPCNPTGMTIEKAELQEIAKLAHDHDLYVISDEIYEYLLYEGEHTSFASLSADAYARTITINGFSKAYAMTGLRVGYAAGPENIMKLAENLQSQMTSNPCSVAQYMALAAADIHKDTLIEYIDTFKTKRDLAVQTLRDAGLPTRAPQGAFYLFVDIRASKLPSDTFATDLLEKYGVAVVPGSAFGTEGYVRVSYATTEQTITQGLKKLAQFVHEVSR